LYLYPTKRAPFASLPVPGGGSRGKPKTILAMQQSIGTLQIDWRQSQHCAGCGNPATTPEDADSIVIHLPLEGNGKRLDNRLSLTVQLPRCERCVGHLMRQNRIFNLAIVAGLVLGIWGCIHFHFYAHGWGEGVLVGIIVGTFLGAVAGFLAVMVENALWHRKRAAESDVVGEFLALGFVTYRLEERSERQALCTREAFQQTVKECTKRYGVRLVQSGAERENLTRYWENHPEGDSVTS